MSLPPCSDTPIRCLLASRPTTNRPIRRDVARSTDPASVSRVFASATSASFMPMPLSRMSTLSEPSSPSLDATVTDVSGAENAVALSSSSATRRIRSLAA